MIVRASIWEGTQNKSSDAFGYEGNDWLGEQANYFTESFELAHQYPSIKNQDRGFYIFLTKCIIGEWSRKCYFSINKFNRMNR